MKAGLFLAIALCGSCTMGLASTDTSVVLSVDDLQRKMVATSDISGLERIAHRSLRINAPGGKVLGREQFLANIKSGEIAAEAFERTVEDINISGNVAIVMGSEIFTPAASSELGRIYGAKPLRRRFTNIYIRENGQWMWRGRHANVILSAAP